MLEKVYLYVTVHVYHFSTSTLDIHFPDFSKNQKLYVVKQTGFDSSFICYLKPGLPCLCLTIF